MDKCDRNHGNLGAGKREVELSVGTAVVSVVEDDATTGALVDTTE